MNKLGNRLLALSTAIALLVSWSASHADQDLVVRHDGIPHDLLFDICFQEAHGLAVGGDGVVVASDDGGGNWHLVTIASNESALLGVTCEPDQRIVVGQHGAIYVEREQLWQKAVSGTDERLMAVDAHESGLGVAVGSFGTILLTRDFGDNWSAVTVNWEGILNDFFEPHLYDVSISTDATITVVGEFGLILQSIDGGLSWQVRHREDSSLFALHMSANGPAFAVGQRGTILRSDDDGETWQKLRAEGVNNLLGVWASEQGEVVVTGIRTLLRSSDGGVNWRIVKEGDVTTGWYQGIGTSIYASKEQTQSLAKQRVFIVGHMGRVVEILE